MKNLLENKYFIYTVLALFLGAFAKIMHSSYNFQHEQLHTLTPKYIYAEHNPIKIYPSEPKEKLFAVNQKVYDFVNEKDWKLKPKIKQKKEPKIDAPKLKSIEQTKKKTETDTLKYKKHTVKIIEKPKKTAAKIITKNVVQLGAFATIEKAETEKFRIMDLFPKTSKGNHFHIERARLKNKGIIYRLKVGPFDNTNAAKSFCDNLRKKSIECFLTVN